MVVLALNQTIHKPVSRQVRSLSALGSSSWLRKDMDGFYLMEEPNYIFTNPACGVTHRDDALLHCAGNPPEAPPGSPQKNTER